VTSGCHNKEDLENTKEIAEFEEKLNAEIRR